MDSLGKKYTDTSFLHYLEYVELRGRRAVHNECKKFEQIWLNSLNYMETKERVKVFIDLIPELYELREKITQHVLNDASKENTALQQSITPDFWDGTGIKAMKKEKFYKMFVNLEWPQGGLFDFFKKFAAEKLILENKLEPYYLKVDPYIEAIARRWGRVTNNNVESLPGSLDDILNEVRQRNKLDLYRAGGVPRFVPLPTDGDQGIDGTIDSQQNQPANGQPTRQETKAALPKLPPDESCQISDLVKNEMEKLSDDDLRNVNISEVIQKIRSLVKFEFTDSHKQFVRVCLERRINNESEVSKCQPCNFDLSFFEII